jgi:hypothetical protein
MKLFRILTIRHSGFYLFWLAILLFSCRESPRISGQNKISSSADTGWVELINGKDFTGWKANESDSTWTIVDQCFQAHGSRSHLFYISTGTLDSFENFEIEVLVKTYDKANSGIYFHTHYQPEGWPGHGIEIQVNNSHIGAGDYREFKKMGSLYGIRNVYKSFGKDSVWNTIRAKMEYPRVQVWVNSVKTADYYFATTPETTHKAPKGTFALQGHDPDSKMQYKSFKVKRLSHLFTTDSSPGIQSPWADSLQIYQNAQFAFIDMRPASGWDLETAKSYMYNTGIHMATVWENGKSHLPIESYSPLFTGISIQAKDLGEHITSSVDYTLGISQTLEEAGRLLGSGKINSWAHEGSVIPKQYWNRLLQVAKQKKVAIEINNQEKVPSPDFILAAKKLGCKFSMAGLASKPGMPTSFFILETIRHAGLEYKDFYIPGLNTY